MSENVEFEEENISLTENRVLNGGSFSARREDSLFVRLVIKSGIIKNRRVAEYVIIGVSLVLLILAFTFVQHALATPQIIELRSTIH